MVKLRIGFISTSQKSFPGDKEAQFRRSVETLEKYAAKLNYELFVHRESVITEADAEKAVRAMEARNIDFLLVQCTSFSGGIPAQVLARLRNARLGLWAIPEGACEGAVPFNSFCCVNMYSSIIGHYLKEHKIPFKWFYGNEGHQLFDRRFEITVRVLTAIKDVCCSKLALIGGIAPGFNDLYFDERRILKTFDGLRINRLHEYSEIKDRAMAYKTEELASIMQEMAEEAKEIHPKSMPLLETNARFYKAYKDFIAEYAYDGIAISCWPKFQDDFRFSVCSVVAKLNDDGIVTACEGDLTSVLSMLILKQLSGTGTLLMDLSDFDEEDETILLWHCGPASKVYAGAGGYKLGVNYHGLPHESKQELNCCGITRDMVFKPGHATIARITGECDGIFLAEGDFINYEKKSFYGSRGWMGNLKLNREAVTVRDFINTILVQGFQHHYPIVSGDLTREVKELAAWLNMGFVKRVPYQEYMQGREDRYV